MKELSDDFSTIALKAARNIMVIFAIFLLVPGAFGYPNGAPPGICSLDKQQPNHNGLSPQVSPAPYDVFMSKDRVTSLDDKIIVTIKSTTNGPAFKGFLVLAKDKTGAATGTWEDDSQSHPLAGCSATTHDNKLDKHEVKLTWKPQGHVPDGPISMTAVIVQRFDLFWANIPVSVKGSDQSSAVFQTPLKGSEPPTIGTTTAVPKGGVPLPGLSKPSAAEQSKDSNKQSASQLSTTLQPKVVAISTVATPVSKAEVASTTTIKATTTKRRSFIDGLLNRGGNTEKATSAITTPTTTTVTLRTTTTTTTTTKKPEIQSKQDTVTTETSTTTKAPGFFKRIFGRKDSSS